MQLSVKDAAQLLDVPEETVYGWIKQGAIPFHRVNDQYLFNKVDLLEWATAAGLRISADLFARKNLDTQPFPSIYEAIKAGGIIYNVAGTDSTAVLQSIVALLKLPGDIDRNFLYQVLLARESLGSTGIGNGIAIPHVRNPVILQSSRPSITLCFLDNPIDFKAIDGKPVHILFTIISPTVNSHLHLLSRLSYLLNNKMIQDALDRHAPEQELLDLIARIESELIGK